MATQKRVELFGEGDPKCVNAPFLLLNIVLDKLPREQQIEHITAVLLQQEVWGSSESGTAISLVEALEKLFENQEVAFRAHLMKICAGIPIQAGTAAENKWKTNESNESKEVAPGLRLAILGKIIQGWAWYNTRSEPDFRLLKEDAEVCFLFLCETYKSAPSYYRTNQEEWGEVLEGEIRKEILKLFRKHFANVWHPWPRLQASKLDPWILRDETPEEIKKLLLHAQIRIGGVELAEERIRLLPPEG